MTLYTHFPTFKAQLEKISSFLVSVVEPLSNHEQLLKLTAKYKIGVYNFWSATVNECIPAIWIHKKVMKALMKRKCMTAFSRASLLAFAEESPTIAYAFSLRSKHVYTSFQSVRSEALAEISVALKGTPVYLRFQNSLTSSYELLGDLAALPQEIQYEIFRVADVESQSSLLCTNSHFCAVESYHRAQYGTFGDLVLQRPQLVALRWAETTFNAGAVAQLKAPAGWGKTTFAALLAAIAAQTGKRVLVLTTSPAIATILGTLQRVLGAQLYPLDAERTGSLSFLAPKYSREHLNLYQAGRFANINIFHKVGCPLAYYMSVNPDLIIVDRIPDEGDFSTLHALHKAQLLAKVFHLSPNRISCFDRIPIMSFGRYVSGFRTPAAILEILDRPFYTWYDQIAQKMLRMYREEGECNTQAAFALACYDRSFYQPGYAMLQLALYLAKLYELHGNLLGNTVVVVRMQIPSASKAYSTYMKPEKGADHIKKILQDMHSQLHGAHIILDNKKGSRAEFEKRSHVAPTTFVTTYRKLASAGPLATADNLLLFEANLVNEDWVRNAVGKVRHATNPRKRVRIIAFSDHSPADYIKIAARLAERTFMEQIMIDGPGGLRIAPKLNVPSPLTFKGDRVTDREQLAPFRFYLDNSPHISATELYFLCIDFSRTLNDRNIEWIKEKACRRGLFRGIDIDVIVGMKEGKDIGLSAALTWDLALVKRKLSLIVL